jgi:hypothetical protein
MLAWAAGQIEPLLLQKLEFVLEENRVYRALLDRHAPPGNHFRMHIRQILRRSNRVVICREALTYKGPFIFKLLHYQALDMLPKSGRLQYDLACSPGRLPRCPFLVRLNSKSNS